MCGIGGMRVLALVLVLALSGCSVAGLRFQQSLEFGCPVPEEDAEDKE